MDVAENVMEIKTEADSNDITETVNPLHDKPSTGVIHNIYLLTCLEFAMFYLLLFFLYTTVIVTVIDECKHSHIVMLHVHFYV